MNISELSISRPVLATVMNMVIVIFGVIAYFTLGIREYPSVDNPIISVSTSYAGASPEIIETQITDPIEEQLNSIPGIRSLSSRSSLGSSRITVEFELSVDMERAANDVRDKVSRAQRFLPRDCDPPTVSKQDADASPIMMIAVSSDKRSILEVSEIADLSIAERLQTIENVSSVSIWGEKRYAMRIWLDPAKMAAYGVTASDIRNAFTRENVELPAGKLRAENTELSVRARGYLRNVDDFKNIIIRSDGVQIVRVSDVARVELGAQDIEGYQKFNGVPSLMLVVIPQPGSNHIEIADQVYRRVEELKKDIPEDIKIDYTMDNTKFIRASIAEVEESIYFAFVLVIIIIFLFLRDWRVTLIPVIVIPISLVGAFFIMFVAGFSINVLTLLALVLAVGLVVDDAIVVTENIYVKIENGMSPREAAITGSKEIFFAVVSTTVTLASVFIPVMFITGMTGKLLVEFCVVMAGTVVISSFVALTLTPMLSAKMLKKREKRNWFYNVTEPFFEKLNTGYEKLLSGFLKRRYIAPVIMIIAVVFIVLLWMRIPGETAPLEDRSQFSVNIRMPEGSSFNYVSLFSDQLATEVDTTISREEIRAILPRVYGGSGSMQFVLTDINERERTQDEIATQVQRMFSKHTIGQAIVQQPQTFTRSWGQPVQYVIQATDLDKLREYLPRFLEKARQSEVLTNPNPNLLFNSPELNVSVDRDRAYMMGVSTNDVQSTLQYAMSGQRYGYFYMNSQQYEIIGELERSLAMTPLDLSSVYLRNDQGQMIQLSNLIVYNEDVAPATLYHYNRFRSATISAGLAPGYTIGQGIEEMDRIASEVLDDTFRTALSGASKDFADSESSLMFIFALALVLIFLVLAAQFESFKDPVIILMTVPLALFGALLFMWIFGVTMNIYSQIGLIMLIGLVAKNGILIVEFANQRKEKGMPKMEAIVGASTQRLRPILMTSLSTVVGLFPLVFASGEGANGRIAMGITVVGGMFISTFMTLFIVPAVYSYISTSTDKITRRNQ